MQDPAARYVFGHGGRRVAASQPRPIHLSYCVFILGSGESGKSTIVKQMKIINLKGYSEEELYNYRPTVFKNLVECAKAVITAMQQFNIELAHDENRAHAEFLIDYQAESGPQAHIDPKVGLAVQAIWSDPAKEQLMEHQTEFYLMDSAE